MLGHSLYTQCVNGVADILSHLEKHIHCLIQNAIFVTWDQFYILVWYKLVQLIVQLSLDSALTFAHVAQEMAQRQLISIEESEIAYSSDFIVPFAKLQNEAPEMMDRDLHTDNLHNLSTDTQSDRTDNDDAFVSAQRQQKPFLLKFMAEVIKKARARALNSTAAGTEAALKSTNYGVSLANLERFVLQSDPLANYAGLYLCEPAPARHPDSQPQAPPRRCWLCAEHVRCYLLDDGFCVSSRYMLCRLA